MSDHERGAWGRGGGGHAHYATVQKLLDRLEAKGCVRRDRVGRAHRFAAAVGREDLIGERLEELAEKLCGGSLTPLLAHLVQPARLSREERQELRRLLDELNGGRPRRGRRKGGRP